MIHFNIFFNLPIELWKTLYSWNKKLSTNKAVEFNVYRTSTLFQIKLDFTTRCDHAGLNIELGCLFHQIELVFYDVRHWDYKLKQWEKYD